MALNDENDTEQTTESTMSAKINPANINAEDPPDFIKNYKSQNPASSTPLDMEVPFVPQNPFTLTTNATSLGQSADHDGLKEEAGFFQTAKAEAANFNATAQGIHAGYEKLQQVNPQDDLVPAGWTSKTDMSKFINIQPQNMKYIFDATGPKDQDYRLQRVMKEQKDDETLANGSFLAKLVGGAVGIATDPMSYIPILGEVKYAKFAPTITKSIARSVPGVATYSVLSSAAEQANKTSGNMQDFVKDAFVRTVFGTVLFGGMGAAKLSADKMALWGMRNAAKGYIDGVDFKMATDASGKVTGFKAVDPSGSLSAAKVTFYQDIANSSFHKGGLFKVPYVGEGMSKLLALKIPGTDVYLGSQLSSLLNSPIKAVGGIVDRIVDHTIMTKGGAEGKVAPQKFGHLLNQTFAGLRAMSAQMNALHLERNGFDITNRPLGGLVNLGLNLKDKATKAFSENIDKTGYVGRDTFDSEIEDVLRTKTPSPHSAVNEGAAKVRKQLDDTYSAYRKAYNLPADWLPPKTAEGYLMRVYNTPYMNVNKDAWVKDIAGWLNEADQTINSKMDPINSLGEQIKDFESKHTQAVRVLANLDAKRIETEAAKTGIEKGATFAGNEEAAGEEAGQDLLRTPEVMQLSQMRMRHRAMKEDLQNELRSNPDLQLHVDDWNAVSADEAKQIKAISKPLNDIEKEIEKQKAVIKEIKNKTSRKLYNAKVAPTIDKAIPKSEKFVSSEDELRGEVENLKNLEEKHFIESERLQDKMHRGEIDRKLFTQEPNSFKYKLKDPEDRLKFRDTYNSEKNPISAEAHAEAYYTTIMHQRPEDTINQVMGRFTGNQRENPIKQRTLLVPDEVVKPYMTKDLMAKVSNYTSYLDRRTHLKTVFNDVSVEGGFEPVLNEVTKEFNSVHDMLNKDKTTIQEKLKDPDLSSADKNKLEKQMLSTEKEIVKRRKGYDSDLKNLNHIYEKMMSIKKYSKGQLQAKSVIMSLTAIANLPFVPFTMINDISAVGLQHGIWPFIRDGVYPIVESIAGLLKTKDSEALRKSAPSVHLGLQDMLNGYADRNWGMQTDPYLNLGRFVHGLESIAHANSNFTLTNYFDNGLQHITGAVTQSEFMRIMHDFKAGKMSKRDGIYIRKYGLDPEKWADRFIAAFKQDGGGKTKLGGYQSNFWHWQDLEAANEMGSAVFRGIKDTQIQSGIADSPFWSDSIMGSIVKGFNGWMYASVNRYVIPSMQQPDAQKMLGVLFMLGTGALVDPMRRMARGEDPYPENVTDKQKMWSAISNSGYFSIFTQILADANVLTGDRLLDNLKNDKYKDRTRAGLLGPAWGTVNRMADIFGAAASGEWNKSDMNKAARMIPFANASWTYWMSKKLTDSLDIPDTRAQAHALKEMNN